MVILSALAFGALITGSVVVVGAIYTLCRTYFVQNNHELVVFNPLESDPEEQIKILPSGVNVLLNPLREVKADITKKDQTFTLESENKSADNIDLRCKAAIVYKVTDAKLAYRAAEDYKQQFETLAAATIGEALREIEYLPKTTEVVSKSPESSESSDEHKSSASASAPKPVSMADEKKSWERISAAVIDKIKEQLRNWGMEILSMKIINLEAKQESVNKEISDLRIKVKQAEIEAIRQRKLAQGERDATQIRADGANQAAQMLQDPNALRVYELEKMTETAKAYGSSATANVMSIRASANPTTFYSQQKPQDALPAPTASASGPSSVLTSIAAAL